MIDGLGDGRQPPGHAKTTNGRLDVLMYHMLNRAAGRATLFEKDADYERMTSRLVLGSSRRHCGRAWKPK
ncbi:MAG: hypothetical protein Q7R41_02205 [Phycisphaerales bacterium]|nr:hypothetical protein [Phycisphaerales bacterium]